tara:strand:- start:330 stop:1259 length:930 start_codon:yes stop_codon:yes gene_type:complete
MNIVGYRSPFKKISSVKPSPMKNPAIIAALKNPAVQQALIAAAPGLISAVGSLFGRKKRRREQRAAREEMRKARAAFEGIEYVNPYANLENPYEGMENVYEDMTVDTQAADYLKEQQQQSQANIMQQFRGVAGGSGIGALAQSLSKIAAGQAQQASAQIAQQERQNKTLAAREASRLDTLQRQGQFGVDKMKAYGEALRRQQEDARTTSLYGLSMDRMDAANKARQLARQQFISGIGSAAAGVAGLYAPGGSLYGTNPFSGGGNTTIPLDMGYTTPVVTPTGGEITGTFSTDYNYGFDNNTIPTNPYTI